MHILNIFPLRFSAHFQELLLPCYDSAVYLECNSTIIYLFYRYINWNIEKLNGLLVVMFRVNDRKERIHRTGLSISWFNLQTRWCNPSHLTSAAFKIDAVVKWVTSFFYLVKAEMQLTKSFSSYLGGVKLILSCEILLLSANYEWSLGLILTAMLKMCNIRWDRSHLSFPSHKF